MSNSQDGELRFKVSITGDSGIGKTSLLLRYTEDAFNEDPIANIGVDYKQKIITRRNKKVVVRVWDTAGQERFRTISASFYRGGNQFFTLTNPAQGVIVAFDVSDEQSFKSAEQWLIEVQNYTTQIPILIVGTKIDVQSRKVSIEEAKNYADSKGIRYFETSSKNGVGVNEAFDNLVELMMNEVERRRAKDSSQTIAVEQSKKKRKICTIL